MLGPGPTKVGRDVDTWEAIGRVALAALLGGVIGMDRELRGHAAGLRTNVLVAAAVAVFADVSINGFAELRGYDPSRVAADVVSGIGFLGAGAIFAMGGRPRGLTTAAALWASAAIGLSVGVGRWQVGLGLVVLSLVALVLLNLAADRLLANRRVQVRDLYVVLPDAASMTDVQRHLFDHHVRIRKLDMVALGAHVGVDLVLDGTEGNMERALATVHAVAVVRFASNELGAEERE